MSKATEERWQCWSPFLRRLHLKPTQVWSTFSWFLICHSIINEVVAIPALVNCPHLPGAYNTHPTPPVLAWPAHHTSTLTRFLWSEARAKLRFSSNYFLAPSNIQRCVSMSWWDKWGIIAFLLKFYILTIKEPWAGRGSAYLKSQHPGSWGCRITNSRPA